MNWKKLNIKDKKEIDKLNLLLGLNYSYCNYANLFLLDLDNDTEVTKIQSSWVIKSAGMNDESQTVRIIGPAQEYAEIVQALFCNGIAKIDFSLSPIFKFELDQDNADYFYKVDDLIKLEGKNYEHIRRKINSFNKNYQIHSSLINNPDEIWSFVSMLNIGKELNESSESEMRALEKLLIFKDQLGVEIIGVKDNDSLIGFSVVEKICGDTLLIHFFKTDHSYKGLAEVLFTEIAKYYQGSCKLINFEQDLGIPGLKQFKESLRPTYKPELYTIYPLS